MKIAFVYDVPYPWHMGGIEKINRVEAEVLANENEVHFFTMQWLGMKKDFVDHNIHYHTFFPVTTGTFYRHKRRSIRTAIFFSLSLFRIFRYRFDVLIIDQFPYLHIPIALLYGKLKGCKVIIRVAEVWDNGYWNDYAGKIFGNAGYYISKLFVGKGDVYIANSSLTSDRMHKILHIEKKRISIFTPVIDNFLIKNIKNEHITRKYDVIFVGRFIKEKRIDKWLEIIKELKRINKNINTILIGDGPEKNEIKNIIKKSGLKENVKIIPHIKKTGELYRVMRSASVMLNMSEREGLSMVTLESLSLGTPVVIPTYSPIPNEVKSMCIVEKEEDIPKRIIGILNGKKTEKKIKNYENLKIFYISYINDFYKKIFKRIL